MEQNLEQLMSETAKHYEDKMAELWAKNKQLINENKGLKGKIRGFRRTVRRLKDELAEAKRDDRSKPHYRNGRRGTMFNG